MKKEIKKPESLEKQKFKEEYETIDKIKATYMLFAGVTSICPWNKAKININVIDNNRFKFLWFNVLTFFIILITTYIIGKKNKMNPTIPCL